MNDCLTIAPQHGGIGEAGVLLWFGRSGLAMQTCRINRAKALVLLFDINYSGGKPRLTGNIINQRALSLAQKMLPARKAKKTRSRKAVGGTVNR